MPPYLQTVKSFADVPINGGVNTLAFLEASEGVMRAIEYLQITAYTVIQNDLKGNIEKIRIRHDTAPDQAVTLEALVENEKTEGTRTATQGLLWLVRALLFTCRTLQYSQDNPNEDLVTSCNKAYKQTLEQFHNFVVKATFQVAMKACPYRADFYNKLAVDPMSGIPQPQENLKEDLTKWLSGLEKIVTQLQAFYRRGNHAEGFK